jgi:Frag1/DRAM/Sfk1 family
MWLLWPPYWTFPVISAGTWLGMLLAMLIRWEVVGHPHYPSMDPGQNIAYISDVGAYGLKPLFIAGNSVTTVFLVLSFIAERWLRHTGRLARNTHTSQKILSVFSIIFGIAGAAGLILLAIFDTYHHPHLHDGFLLLFIAGYVISAIFLCAGYQRLGIHYRNHRILRISFWVKLLFILVELAFAIIFVCTDFKHVSNVAAVFEWIVAFTFTFYILSFLLDLLPSVQTRHHKPQGWKDEPMGLGMSEAAPYHTNGEYPGALTNDSAGPNDNLEGGYRGTAPAGNEPSFGYATPYGQNNSMATASTLTNGLVHDQTTIGQPEDKEDAEVVPAFSTVGRS